jgi:hypothetical protein
VLEMKKILRMEVSRLVLRLAGDTIEVEVDAVGEEVAEVGGVVVRLIPGARGSRILRRQIGGRRRIRPVGLIIIGANNGQRRLREEAACRDECHRLSDIKHNLCIYQIF